MIKLLYKLNLVLTFIWSQIINTCYWIKHIRELRSAIRKKNELAKKMETIEDVGQAMIQFVWKEDPYYDWIPWIVTIINEKYNDDCNGASVLGKFLLKQIGIPSRILHLRKKGSRIGHAICLSNDNRILVSNNHVTIFNKATRNLHNWEFNVLEFFKFRYDYIL